MRSILRPLLGPAFRCALFLTAAPALAQAPTSAPTTVVLVRHAEKAAEPASDPPLAPEGIRRARSLVEVMGGRADVILTTPFARTRDTAAPLAERSGATRVEHGISEGLEAHVAALRDDILTRRAGQRVLVVGHSNTIPALVEALAGHPVAPLTEAEYDRLYVVVIAPDGGTRLFQAKY